MQITVRSIDVHYQEVGAGVPVINLHGWPAEHGQMLAMMEPLFAPRQGWRRIYVDLPGMGKTPGADWLTSHDLMLEFIAEFIERVAGERAALVGHSYGAQLVRGLLQGGTGQYVAALLLSPGEWACRSSGQTPSSWRKTPGSLPP